MEAEFFRADGRTYTTKLIVAFINSANAPQIDKFLPVYYVDAIMPRNDQYSVLIFMCDNFLVARGKEY